ncbi:hypothetical protein EVAR_29970_1 [Eumeta japonica]|uniref:Uncharacterized protein n=1 Tax=Eumeta variegata TaxID=151549 RepID=A0A4C1VF73_EUMVA|nr:hypothetical protein EVAR_29970_1 [Eumeta japonica]
MADGAHYKLVKKRLDSSTRSATGTYQEQTEKIIVLPGLAILAPPRVYALCLGTGGTALFMALFKTVPMTRVPSNKENLATLPQSELGNFFKDIASTTKDEVQKTIEELKDKAGGVDGINKVYMFFVLAFHSIIPHHEADRSSLSEQNTTETEETQDLLHQAPDSGTGEEVPQAEVPRVGGESIASEDSQNDRCSSQDVVSEQKNEVEVRNNIQIASDAYIYNARMCDAILFYGFAIACILVAVIIKSSKQSLRTELCWAPCIRHKRIYHKNIVIVYPTEVSLRATFLLQNDGVGVAWRSEAPLLTERECGRHVIRHASRLNVTAIAAANPVKCTAGYKSRGVRFMAFSIKRGRFDRRAGKTG